jgi:hypothetical protein
MAKRKPNKNKEIEVSLVEWADPSTQVGTPTMVLLPSRNYYFKILEGNHKITIPRNGTYHELDSSFFSKEDGEFMLFNEENNVMYLPAITKVLFAVKKYPDLERNQLFAPIALVFKENEVDVLGQIIEIMDPPNKNEDDTAKV